MSDITEQLRQAAQQIADEGHDGWGDTCAEAADEITRLREQVAALTAERDGLREDALRYRWLRKDREVSLVIMYFGNGCINKTIEDAEAAIDAARAALGDKTPTTPPPSPSPRS